MAKNKLLIDAQKPPRVLMIGNGLLLLNNGMGWSDLIKTLAPDPTDIPDVRGIPYAMQPEAVCGTDVENIQRLIAENIKSKDPHEILRQLAFMDFDAILTTNYTYEIEEALTGGNWSENKRVKSHTTLYGSPHVRYNTYKCNLVKDINDRELPVFHIHGEQARKHSMVLSYYSYAESVYRLIEMNKRRKNAYEEHQATGASLVCEGWLDYFLLGEVYAVGFGFDLSEFDIWWAIERKSREHAIHGGLHIYTIAEMKDMAKSTLYKSMSVDEKYIHVTKGQYERSYAKVIQSFSLDKTT